MSAAIIAGQVGQLALGVVGEVLAGMDEEERANYLRQAMDEFGNIDVPKLEEIVSENLGPTELRNVAPDAESVQMQREAMREMMNLAKNGGMRLEDKAAQQEAMNAAALQNRAQQGSIRQDMQMRGMGGSGMEIQMRQQAAQAAAQRNNQAGMQSAAEAQRRSLQAMMEGGRMAGQFRQQDYGEKARAAEAQDSINKLSHAGRTRAQYHNANLGQQNFQNQMSLGAARANGYRSMADLKADSANGKRTMFGGAGKAAADMGEAYADPTAYLKRKGGR